MEKGRKQSPDTRPSSEPKLRLGVYSKEASEPNNMW